MVVYTLFSPGNYQVPHSFGTEKVQKENPHREFQRKSKRGSGREVSGPEFFMLVSFSQQNTAHKEF